MSKRPITRLLIANRGEIAVRIAGAARSLAIDTVAIHPADDAASLHVRRCNHAVQLEGTGAEAYLDIDAIVSTAVDAGCDAVHPGYGFLAENSAFAQACAKAGLTFVGPSAEVLALFGNKSRARALARGCGVPVVPAVEGPITLEQAVAFHAELGGRPLVLKAVAGGGGRGMRIVRSADAMEAAFQACRSEAQRAFGEDALQVECLLDSVRHIEVQIIADHSGSVVHAGERDCSLQRRNQKLIEFAPCADLPGTLREQLTEAAIRLARQAGYTNAGTFEFLVDTWSAAGNAQPKFYFLESNPRIQVEHPVTEEAFGFDLVQTQLQIAGGASLESLGITQQRLAKPVAHSMELRINLEQMRRDGGVLPSTGVIRCCEMPGGPGVRIDAAGYAGYDVPGGYDSLIAKIIVTVRTADRETLLRKGLLALQHLNLTGVEHNAALLRTLLARREMLEGGVHTRFIDDHWGELFDALGRSGETSPDIDPVSGLMLVRSELQGVVVEITVEPGRRVSRGHILAVLDAMKMEHPVESPCWGVVREVHVRTGHLVGQGELLIGIEAVAEADEEVESAVRPEDPEDPRPELAALFARREWLLDRARPEAVARRRGRGQRTARENVEDLFDEGSFSEYGGLAIAAQRRRRSEEDLIRSTPADGIITGIGSINGNLFDSPVTRCAVLAYDYTVLAGTQGTVNHHKTDRIIELAHRGGLPTVLFSEGGGGRPGDVDANGVAGLDISTFRKFAELSGRVPLVGINSGRCFAGNAALLGCCDVIIATRNSSIGMGGPAMIEGGGLGVVLPEEVGPVSVQEPNGVIDLLVADEAEGVAAAKRYLAYFQGTLRGWEAHDQRLLRTRLPVNRRRVYDVREVITTLADVDSVMELRQGYGHGMVTCLARLEGRVVGVLANNPAHLGGAVDGPAADKASRFMQLCDAFGLPIVSLCDTPGFMVGPDSEKTAVVRRFARLFVTAGGMTTPVLAVVMRRAYGLGAMAMAGGAFTIPALAVSWPAGEFGGMGLEGAIKLGLRKELEAIEDPEEREAFYQRAVAGAYHHGRAENAAAHVEIDDVIDPAETRERLLLTLRNFPVQNGFPRTNRNHIDTW